MSIFYLILFVVLIIFAICALVGLFRFLADTRKFSSYYNELVNLKEKAEQRYNTAEEKGEELKID